ncbi:MAG: hypothetical protein NT169_19520 [Chloroflexi bacterium]|nr:hypothetical protein [Chloroflexota bacterium]
MQPKAEARRLHHSCPVKRYSPLPCLGTPSERLPPNIDKVLDLTGLKTQFMIFATEAEAVGSF